MVITGLFQPVFCADVFLGLDRSAYTPTGDEVRVRQFPQSASVVTKEDISMTNAKQTTDILGQLPGLYIRKTSAFGRADVDIRGIGDSGRQIGVFIDGRPDKMGMFGCAVTHTLPMNNVERIEVIRGPESVLYGSEAFGGVINIITKRAERNMEGSFTASGGTYNTQNYRLQQGSRQGKFDYYLSADKRSTDGHKENSAYNASDCSIKMGYKTGDRSEILLGGKYFTGIKNEPFPSAAGTWNDYSRGSADVTYKQAFGDFTGSLKTYRSFGWHRFSDGFVSNDYTNGVMLHGKTPLSAENELSIGIDYRYQFGEIENVAPAFMIGQYHKYEYGVYADDKHTFFDRLTVNAGARFNYDEFAEQAVTSRAGAVYNLSPDTILRGVWSQGFRAPQLNDLYLWAGNTELKPEKVTNTEVGVRHYAGDRVYVDVGGFVMKGSDLIQAVSGKKINIGEFEFKGVETACNLVFSKNVNAQLNYTYMDPGTQTTGRPGDKAGASVKYEKGRIKGLVSADYVAKYYAADNSQQKIDDYAVLNARADWEAVKGLSVFCAVENIGDAEYSIYYSGLYEMPGRTATLGIEYAF